MSGVLGTRCVAGAEDDSRDLQFPLNPRCDRVRAAKHAPHGPCQFLERRHALAEIAERGAGVFVERPRVCPAHPEREIIVLTNGDGRQARGLLPARFESRGARPAPGGGAEGRGEPPRPGLPVARPRRGRRQSALRLERGLISSIPVAHKPYAPEARGTVVWTTRFRLSSASWAEDNDASRRFPASATVKSPRFGRSARPPFARLALRPPKAGA